MNDDTTGTAVDRRHWDRLGAAQTILFVPGDRPDRFQKALDAGADLVVADLEDAVPPDRKAEARATVIAALESGMPLTVRINPSSSPFHADDVRELAAARVKPLAVHFAKAEDPGTVRAVIDAIRVPVFVLIESAKGLLNAAEFSRIDGVLRFGFGQFDYALDVGAVADPMVMAYPRSHVVAVTRAAGLAGALDTPALEFRDLDRVRATAELARRFGMSGLYCIHPAQIEPVLDAFSPSDAEADRARRLLAAAKDDGAGSFEGEMIDWPLIERARRTVAAWEARQAKAQDAPAHQ